MEPELKPVSRGLLLSALILYWVIWPIVLCFISQDQIEDPNEHS